jgi:hypothetical protein
MFWQRQNEEGAHPTAYTKITKGGISYNKKPDRIGQYIQNPSIPVVEPEPKTNPKRSPEPKKDPLHKTNAKTQHQPPRHTPS